MKSESRLYQKYSKTHELLKELFYCSSLGHNSDLILDLTNLKAKKFREIAKPSQSDHLKQTEPVIQK